MKKELLFSLCFLAGTTLLSAQSNCLIGLHGGVTQSQYVSPDGLSSAIRSREPFFSANVGISLRQDFKEKFYWQTGLQYVQFGERVVAEDNLRWPSEHDGNGGYVRDPALPHRLEYEQKTDYVTLRAGVGYYLLRSEKFGLGVMPFAEAGFFIKNKNEQQFIYDDGNIDSSSGDGFFGDSEFRNVNASVGLALSFQAKVASKFDVFLAPDASYQLLSATVGNGADANKRRYFAGGLNAGVFYRL
ncbi:MAG: outer membrane beta-barrel protein [Saprospiraceae bacterium]